MRSFSPALALLVATGLAVPAFAETPVIEVPGHLSKKEARQFGKLQKQEVELREEIADRELDLFKARERVAKEQERLAKAESRLRDAQSRFEREERALEQDRRELGDTERRLAELRGDNDVELSRR